eukprot:CAMPEP_0172851640 /NCGR_PEP_ID=MMETSP1075-20121228/51759_1 /TAXON_ID=2916 /ORGANISM="Ceratium fusus, Strain PA161109" /LENGTH=133 /DNA_ID=CAMNT_0013697693 /DNA_START=38 /DNA_END=435 /DNA_ORIENTATION=+
MAAREKAAEGQGGPQEGIADLPKPEFHVVDMSKAEQDFAVEIAMTGIVSLFKNERRSFCEVAEYMKKELDKSTVVGGGAWHVIVGKHFGAWVTYEAKKLLHFHIGQAGVSDFSAWLIRACDANLTAALAPAAA